jgi:hypothetical protein
MKTSTLFALFAMALGVVASGCSNRVGVTNPEQPGPAVGRAIGTGVGAVVGNVAGAGVGVVEGTTAGVKTSFDNTQRIVRSWREEKTQDGRTIMVPVEYLVDKDGRVIRQIK